MTRREKILHALGTGPRTSRNVSAVTGISLVACRALMSRMVLDKELKRCADKVEGITKVETVYELTGFIATRAVDEPMVASRPRRAKRCHGIAAGPTYHRQFRWGGVRGGDHPSSEGSARTPVRGGMH